MVFVAKAQGHKENQRTLLDFAKASGVSVQFVAQDQMRLWAKDHMAAAPPAKTVRGGLTKSAQAAGIKRVSSDISPLFISVDSGRFRAIQEWLLIGEAIPGNAFRQADGRVYAVEHTLWNPTGDRGEMKRQHASNRSPRSGRTTQAGTFTKDIGRWRFIDRMATHTSYIQKYIRDVAQKVGHLKNGWTEAIILLSRAVKVQARIPAWIRKAGSAKGRANANGIDKRGNGSLFAENSVPYAVVHFPAWDRSLSRKRQQVINKAIFRAPQMRRYIDRWDKIRATG